MELIQALNGLSWPGAFVLAVGVVAVAFVAVTFIRVLSS